MGVTRIFKGDILYPSIPIPVQNCHVVFEWSHGSLFSPSPTDTKTKALPYISTLLCSLLTNISKTFYKNVKNTESVHKLHIFIQRVVAFGRRRWGSGRVK